MRYLIIWMIAPIFILISGCAPTDDASRDGGVSDRGSDSRFASSRAPARLIAARRGDVRGVASGAANLTDETLLSRPGLKYVEASSLPFLTTSVEGAQFLRAPFPRALARGEPAASCPAAAARVSTSGRADAVSAALNACFDLLQARGAGADCGCRITAIDNHLLDRRDAFAYAQTVSALLTGGDRPPAHLIAEALPPADDAQTVILRDINGVVGQIALSGDRARAAMIDAPERIYAGERKRFGYRRGRMAERLELSDATGARLDILIGVERRDASRE